MYILNFHHNFRCGHVVFLFTLDSHSQLFDVNGKFHCMPCIRKISQIIRRQQKSKKSLKYCTIELKKLKEGENKSQIEVSEKGRNIQTFVKKEVYNALVEEKTQLKYELETKKKEADKATS